MLSKSFHKHFKVAESSRDHRMRRHHGWSTHPSFKGIEFQVDLGAQQGNFTSVVAHCFLQWVSCSSAPRFSVRMTVFCSFSRMLCSLVRDMTSAYNGRGVP